MFLSVGEFKKNYIKVNIMEWKSLNLHLFELKLLRVKKEREKFELDNKIERFIIRKENLLLNDNVTERLKNVIEKEREILDKRESALDIATSKLSNEIEMTEKLIHHLKRFKNI